MAAVSESNLCRVRGDTSPFRVAVSNGTAAINITGYTFAFTVDPSPAPVDSANNLFQLTTGSGITITDGPNGIIQLQLSTPQADQAPSVYFYDLQMTDASGLITTILRGQYEVQQDITK